MSERVGAWVPALDDERVSWLSALVRRSCDLLLGLPNGVDPHVVSLLEPTSFEAGRYRALCHQLERRVPADAARVIAVSSPAMGDGKTTTALNLAATLAQPPDAGVLLVDADLRRATAGRRLSLERVDRGGLGDFLEDPGLGPERIVQRSAHGLWVIAAGRCTGDPYALLRSARFAGLIEEARRRYDRVIIDCPPLLLVPDWQVIASVVDGWLLVVRANHTPRKLVEEALSSMETERVLGLVFNGDDRPLSGYYRAYSPYGYPPNRKLAPPGR